MLIRVSLFAALLLAVTTLPSQTQSPNGLVQGAVQGTLQSIATVGQGTDVIKNPELVQFGRQIFHDENLSIRRNMSCDTCHSAKAGGTAAIDNANRLIGTQPGSLFEDFNLPPTPTNTMGFRAVQTNTYAVFSPPLHREVDGQGEIFFRGGNFWDGRATGFFTGRAAQEQAMHPFIGDLEQGLPAPACVVYRVIHPRDPQTYRVRYEALFGDHLTKVGWPKDMDEICASSKGVLTPLPNSPHDSEGLLSSFDERQLQVAYSNIGLGLFAFQKSPDVSPFSSRYDQFQKGEVQLSAQEIRGLQLFVGKAKCDSCHVSQPAKNEPGAMLTDFTYDNLGVPRNPANPMYRSAYLNAAGNQWVDKGLGGFLAQQDAFREEAAANIGKFKVPTLRNVAKAPSPSFVRTYMHNGYFKTLDQVVDFYNSRDLKPACPNPLTTVEEAERQGCWPEPETSANLNRTELGNLGLTAAELKDLVAFLETLSDR